jgi:pyrimidine-specific ribonucleoside hydrolase
MISLIIDTDPALGLIHEGRPRDIDDGFAIVEAINSDEIDLRGITVTFGNAPLDAALGVARDLIALKEVDVPVLAGASQAMPQREGEGALTPAVEFLADTLTAQRCRIAAIGPLTNVATLIQHRPELAEQVEEVVIVAGRSRERPFYLGDVGPVRDFNFECDVRAAQILLSSGIPVVLAGFELSSQVVITQADLERIHARGSPTADYLHRNSLAWCSHWTQQFPHDRGFHPWDSAAIAWLLRPELFETESRGWRIRDVALTREERARNPDGSPESVAWLECDVGFPGIAHTYCTGFKAGKATEFVRHVMDGVY